MDGRTRVNSDTMKGLLGRQLASITDTLARASQRRDTELRQKAYFKSPPAPAAQVPSPTNPSLTSDTEGTGSDSGDSVGFASLQKGRDSEDFSFEDFDASILKGDNVTRSSLPEGYTFDDEDPKTLFESFDRDEPSTSIKDDTSPQQRLVQLSRPEFADRAHDMDDPKTMLAELRKMSFDDEPNSIDVGIVLADMEKISFMDGSTTDGWDIDPKLLLAQFEHGNSAANEVNTHVDGDDDPKRMLADMEGRVSSLQVATMTSSSEDNQKAMLADLEGRIPEPDGEPPENTQGNLEALYDRLMGILSPGIITQSPEVKLAIIGTREADIDPAIVPYFVAFQLEKAGCKWEEVKGWTTYLFSSGLDGYEAHLEKDRIVQQATEELDKTIRYTLGEVERYLGETSPARVSRRLIVSNLAADVGIQDLEEFFYRHRFVVYEFKILSGRDPAKRTQIAHVDMVTREAAVKASYMTGSIFGLMLDIRLAVEQEG
ncbi:hypothetical protein CC86DRAFT_462519 [Ophiobolus disseminans]|uniref:RRM domain-containing protein n=1 Tax=Ophiobolus disseminans TaxID=1469910 RepID=A0A6A7AFV8_9PLEO|nr:hypothetical protein CC86DRAFT_462519 [Ophiobolus disseminans]